MEKNIDFYGKRSRIYGILCPIFLLITIILLFVMNGNDKAHTDDWSIFLTPVGYASIFFGVFGLVFYILWDRFRNKEMSLLRKLKKERDHKEFETMIQLVRDGKSEEAVDKLTQFLSSHYNI